MVTGVCVGRCTCVYGYKVNIYASNTNSVSSRTEKAHWCLVLTVKLLWKDFHLLHMTY